MRIPPHAGEQGPVAVSYSNKANEPAKDILDGIYHGVINMLKQEVCATRKSYNGTLTIDWMPVSHAGSSCIPQLSCVWVIAWT